MKGAASFAKTKKEEEKGSVQIQLHFSAGEEGLCCTKNSMLMWTVVIRLRGSGKSLVSLTDHQVAA